MDKRAIGVFDSGLGGLTAIRQLRKLLPGERIVFLGDTARVPYGIRLPEVVRQFARDDMTFLTSRDVKCIAAACGTVSSNILGTDIEMFDVPIIGLIGPTVRAAVKATQTGRIGVIATQATIASGAFRRALLAASPEVRVYSKACPDLVPLIESGATVNARDELAGKTAEYLLPLKQANVDTLILGCTHYPLISDMISEIMGPSVRLIDSGAEEAAQMAAYVRQCGLSAPEGSEGSLEIFVTSNLEQFLPLARLFLGEDVTGCTSLLTEEQFYLQK